MVAKKKSKRHLKAVPPNRKASRSFSKKVSPENLKKFKKPIAEALATLHDSADAMLSLAESGPGASAGYFLRRGNLLKALNITRFKDWESAGALFDSSERGLEPYISRVLETHAAVGRVVREYTNAILGGGSEEEATAFLKFYSEKFIPALDRNRDWKTAIEFRNAIVDLLQGKGGLFSMPALRRITNRVFSKKGLLKSPVLSKLNTGTGAYFTEFEKARYTRVLETLSAIMKLPKQF